jgi:hypothetical protein
MEISPEITGGGRKTIINIKWGKWDKEDVLMG